MIKSFRYILLACLLAAPAIVLAANVTNDVTTYAGETFASYTNGESVIDSNGWYGDTNEISAVALSTNMTYTGDLPITGTGPTSNNVLSLEAGSGTLTNLFTGVSTNTWIDLLVQMNPADDMPAVLTNSTATQAGVYLNASSNLVILHGATDGTAPTTTNTTSVLTNTTITADSWVRLTFQMDFASGYEAAQGGNGHQINSAIHNSSYYQLMLNGVPVTNATGYNPIPVVEFFGNIPAPTTGGSWFIVANSADNITDRDVDALVLSGAGMFDEIVVTDSDPFFVPAATYTVTVATVTGGSITYGGASPEPVASNNNSQVYTFVISNGFYLESFTNSRDGVITATGNTYSITSVTENITLGAIFAADTALSNGVTEGWLQTYAGVYTNDYTNAAATDADGDGYTTAEEFLASTDPTDATSFLRISSVSTNAGQHELRWNTVYDQNYGLPAFVVQSTTDITSPSSWTNLGVQARTDGTHENIYLANIGSGQYYYYRVVATN